MVVSGTTSSVRCYIPQLKYFSSLTKILFVLHHDLLLILGLLTAAMLLVMVAQKIRIAYPIFLVLCGLCISFIPGLPRINLDPDIIFLLFLPPLLYEAAWYTSWNDFWRWKRPIGLLAFGLVFFTSSIVACISYRLIPGCTLALGFLLGGIVSPPDAVAAANVLKGVAVPKRIMTILEGESLINDASSLIVFRFALAAVLTGSFSFHQAVGSFFLVAGMGVVTGLVIAHIFYVIHRWFPTTPAIDAAFSVMSPYIMYLVAEQFHFSGVMAVVSGGLFTSFRTHEIFRSGNTKLNMLGVWNTMIFVMNAMVFVLIGLDLPEIIGGLGTYSWQEGIKYGLIISAITILLRIIWVFPAAYIPRWLFPSIRKKEVSPGWKGPLIISLAGMRGVVSLATALSIPLLTNNGEAFPLRSLILFITFIVIFVTLVFQGLSLPFIIQWLGLKEIDAEVPSEKQKAAIHLQLSTAALNYLEDHYPEKLQKNELLGFYKKSLENHVYVTGQQLESLECCASQQNEVEMLRQVQREVYSVQRKLLFRMRRNNDFGDEEIRNMELQLDLNEMKLNGNNRH